MNSDILHFDIKVQIMISSTDRNDCTNNDIQNNPQIYLLKINCSHFVILDLIGMLYMNSLFDCYEYCFVFKINLTSLLYQRTVKDCYHFGRLDKRSQITSFSCYSSSSSHSRFSLLLPLFRCSYSIYLSKNRILVLSTCMEGRLCLNQKVLNKMFTLSLLRFYYI